ncbi:MAG: hypothetical protein H6757_04560 [Candidatus Omnitrophica bacterium]|nr:hypothetical protein [Candidatus Omnitrophota bacterium]
MNIRFRAWHLKENKMYFSAYQKILSVLLCDDDKGSNEGKGLPVKEVSYEDCVLMQSTGLFDKNGVEIFEGDLVRIFLNQDIFEGEIREIPDMYKSRRLHPMQSMLEKIGLQDSVQDLTFEVIGHRYEESLL